MVESPRTMPRTVPRPRPGPCQDHNRQKPCIEPRPRPGPSKAIPQDHHEGSFRAPWLWAAGPVCACGHHLDQHADYGAHYCCVPGCKCLHYRRPPRRAS